VNKNKHQGKHDLVDSQLRLRRLRGVRTTGRLFFCGSGAVAHEVEVSCLRATNVGNNNKANHTRDRLIHNNVSCVLISQPRLPQTAAASHFAVHSAHLLPVAGVLRCANRRTYPAHHSAAQEENPKLRRQEHEVEDVRLCECSGRATHARSTHARQRQQQKGAKGCYHGSRALCESEHFYSSPRPRQKNTSAWLGQKYFSTCATVGPWGWQQRETIRKRSVLQYALAPRRGTSSECCVRHRRAWGTVQKGQCGGSGRYPHTHEMSRKAVAVPRGPQLRPEKKTVDRQIPRRIRKEAAGADGGVWNFTHNDTAATTSLHDAHVEKVSLQLGRDAVQEPLRAVLVELPRRIIACNFFARFTHARGRCTRARVNFVHSVQAQA
jgi:hypothetical protein